MTVNKIWNMPYFSAVISNVSLCAMIAACSNSPPPPSQKLADGWTAWEYGRAEIARDIAEEHIKFASSDEARMLFVKATAARGKYDEAIEVYRDISTDADDLTDLDVTVFHAFLHAGRAEDALAFAESRQLDDTLIDAANTRVEKPFIATVSGVEEIEFHDDPLTSAMPGFPITVNGVEHIGRLDTGGAYVHLSPSMAEELGVVASACFEGFANAQTTKVCRGVANITFDSVSLENVPVAVIDALPSGEILGGQLGPVIGTNVLQRFLSTVDPITGMMILSERGSATSRRAHLERLGEEIARVPFIMVGDHLIVAPGFAGDKNVNFFVDTGLLAFDANGDQATLLGQQSVASDWEGKEIAAGGVETLNTKVSMGSASVDGASMLVLPDAAWASFGDFDGVKVEALLSNGFFKQFVWTLDFDSSEIILTKP